MVGLHKYLLLGALLLLAAPSYAQDATPTPIPFESRTYELFVPDDADEAEDPLPIMIVLHGAGGSGARTRGWLGIDELAQEAGFVVVYPDGIGNDWDYGAGIRMGEDIIRSDDSGYLLWLVDRLAEDYPVDPTRIYVAGNSDGALMAYAMACTVPDRLGGIAGVAATMLYGIAQNCSNTPLPVLFIHGSADPILPWERTYARDGRLIALSATDSFTFWGRRNQCSDDVTVEDLPDRDADDGSTVRHISAGDCADATEVQFYAVAGGGHTWPSHPFDVDIELGPVNMDIDASEIIVSWFAQLAARESD